MATNIGTLTTRTRRIRTINIATPGTLSVSSASGLPFIAPAIESAIQELQREYAGVFNWTWELIYDKSTRDYYDYLYSADGLVAKWYYKQRSPADLTVFLYAGGPEVENINRLAAEWNTLMITSTATMPTQRNKRLSPSWLTTGCCLTTNFVKPYVYLMKANNWTSLYLVVDAGTIMTPTVAKDVSVAIKNMKAAQHIMFTIPVGSRNEDTYEVALKDFRKTSRVLFFFGHSDSLKGFLRQAGNMGMLSSEYIYITLEPFRSNPMFGNLTSSVEEDQAAYGSLIVVTIAEYINQPGLEATSRFAQWKSISSAAFNYTYNTTEQLSPHVTSTYYTMLLLAEVLNETLDAIPDVDLLDGSRLARLFFNRTVKIDSLSVYVDEAGERRTDMEIRQFNKKTGDFETIMIQSGATETVTQIRPLNWHGTGQFPSNEPMCGYAGNNPRCTHEDASTAIMSSAIAVGIGLILVTVVVGHSWRRCITAEVDGRTWWDLSDWHVPSSMSFTPRH
ncbi:hypothetical protein BV898_13164 [Hypsibius exemplaris]|uniref:Receptor ligand binding region domain-containing protein n=1 Tax=Hypsibius exemplaris TaxID=2072580 RepID=A0A1W0WBR4_HYPEX|nr:hypothetical protein BV898_13164 [Hypsibius exemplaris]